MLPWLLCALLGGLVLALLGKVRTLTRSMEEICDQMEDRLEGDTNNLLTLSTRDPHARRLAARLNAQLRLLRQQRRQYLNGDRELKEAVTNISHDLRTPLTAICGYLDLLDRQAHAPAVARYLDQIQNRVEAMKALTEELFRYSVLASKETWEYTDVLLNQVLEESLLAHYGAHPAGDHPTAGPDRGSRPPPAGPEGGEPGVLQPPEQRPEIQSGGPAGHPHRGGGGYLLQQGPRPHPGDGGPSVRPFLHRGDRPQCHWVGALHRQAPHRGHGWDHPGGVPRGDPYPSPAFSRINGKFCPIDYPTAGIYGIMVLSSERWRQCPCLPFPTLSTTTISVP